ncbi:hypothetical protein ACVWW6_006045 [Bradyrhizobium sp. USDA 3311]
MPEKCRLNLHRFVLGRYDDIEVVDLETGAPIPFEWVGADILEVDNRYAGVAAVRVVPHKLKPKPKPRWWKPWT